MAQAKTIRQLLVNCHPPIPFFVRPTRQLQTDVPITTSTTWTKTGRDIPAMLISPPQINETANIVTPTSLFRPDWRMDVPPGKGQGLQEEVRGF